MVKSGGERDHFVRGHLMHKKIGQILKFHASVISPKGTLIKTTTTATTSSRRRRSSNDSILIYVRLWLFSQGPTNVTMDCDLHVTLNSMTELAWSIKPRKTNDIASRIANKYYILSQGFRAKPTTKLGLV